ncbi:MAG TPA: DNA mismatch repair endonuclease MutL [bacterium]|nr:DNA mismatch repair endonuclease MutL [bacterium]HOL47080.1 DNA mismatch repair endonuclease MutL [bacterium]HPQ18980.1 DNA mismatch repair endonuclease MutL [bacterium]
MGIINILNETLSNKIAAGEVIERPASVVKELIENSIDAKATYILVEILNAGKSLIKITDNGIGMDKEDAVLCFQRYATSKIKTDNDLFNISSYGFRGEALPSIAAVSEIKLRTKQKDKLEGTEVIIRGGNFQDVRNIGTPEGTIIEVRNLFFNTPARKKYLKTSQTELSNIIDNFINFAIVHPDIHFILFVDNKEVYNLPKVNSIFERIYSIFGSEISDKLIFIENNENKNIKLNGYFGKPEINKISRKYQYIYVNARFVKSLPITYAVEYVYSSLMPKDVYPVFFLFLNIDPTLIDVNVHPTKREIKFSNEYYIRELIINSLKKELIKEDLAYTPEIKIEKIQNFKITEQSFNSNLSEAKIIIEKRIEQNEKLFSADETKIEKKEDIEIKSETLNLKKAHFIGQLFSTYLLFEENNDLIIIDQHALHEKILYSRLKKSFENKEIKSQRLLLPITIEITKKEIEIINKIKDLFLKAGFEIEVFGFNSIIIHSVPILLGKRSSDTKLMINIIDDILEKFENSKQTEFEFIDFIIATTACKAAVKAGDKLIHSEISELIKLSEEIINPYFCPHGRPVKIKIRKEEIEKLFLRR